MCRNNWSVCFLIGRVELDGERERERDYCFEYKKKLGREGRDIEE